VYTLWTSPRILNSSHNWVRLSFLLLQLGHNLVSVVLAWFSLAGFLLTTFVVNDITGDPPDNAPVDGFPFGSATPIFNGVLRVIYLLTIAFQFILALGSRPRGTAMIYIASFLIFTVVQLYLFINLIYLTKHLIDFKLDRNGASSYAYIGEYYADVGSWTILVTAVAMFGTYIGAGVLCLNPWHLLTSWGQYLFISSSYVNILKTYAFSNMHDGTWGQKTGKKVYIAVPIQGIAEPQDSRDQHDIDLEEQDIDREQRDVDNEFEQTVKRALAPWVPEPTGTLEETREETFMKFRVFMVAAYLFSNFFLCILVLNDSFKALSFMGNSYWHKVWFFKIWMWGNSGLLLLQFAGRCYVSLWTWSTCMFQRR
jgi:chitin synthase